MKDRTVFDDAGLLRQLAELEPPPDAMQRALERTRQALAGSQVAVKDLSQNRRRRGRSPWLRRCAMIAAVVMLVVVGTFYAFFAKSGTTSAFAEVQAAFEQVSCVAYSVETIEAPEGLQGVAGTGVAEFARHRGRFESADGESIRVYDFERKMLMHLLPSQKRAFITRLPTQKQGAMKSGRSASRYPTFAEFLEKLRDGDAGTVVKLKDGEIDGRTVQRYRIPPESPISDGAEILASVNPTTLLPVQIEWKTTAFKSPLHIVIKNFSFDQHDPSLFAMVPPEGYEVQVLPEPDTVAKPEAIPATTVELGRPAVDLELRFAEKAPMEGMIEATVPGKPPQTIYLHPEAIVTREDVQNWAVSESERAIVIVFTAAGSARMAEATSRNLPKHLALLIEGQVVSAPMVFGAISNKARLFGLPPDLLQRLSASASRKGKSEVKTP